MLAREELMAMLTGEYGVDLKEEGFMAPASPLIFFWIMFSGLALCLLAVEFSPAIPLFGLVIFGGSLFLFFDYRPSPLLWLLSQRMTANLVAEKMPPDSRENPYRPLFIIHANLDSPPVMMHFQHQLILYFPYFIWGLVGLLGMIFLLSVLGFAGLFIPKGVIFTAAVILLLIPLYLSVDYWMQGYSKGMNDNLSGVAAATEVAVRLFRDMPDNLDIRLLLTSGAYMGGAGMQHYLSMHQEELEKRPVSLISLHGIGTGDLSLVRSASPLLPQNFHGSLIRKAYNLSKDGQYGPVAVRDFKAGGLESVIPMRAGVDSLTIVGLSATDPNQSGFYYIPHMQQVTDQLNTIDTQQIENCVTLTEALIRLHGKQSGAK